MNLKNSLRFLLTAILFQAFCGYLYGQEKGQLPFYHLKVRIDPALSMIEGKTEIRNPKDSCFFLSKNLKIQHITADGKQISYHQKTMGSSDNYFEFIIEAKNLSVLEIDYSGRIIPDSFPKTISMLNMIKTGLVELSDHIEWYPGMKNNTPFNYKLDIDLPTNYVTLANGLLKKQQLKYKRNLTEWESAWPVSGITLFAAPDLRKADIIKDGITIEIYYNKLPVTYIDSMKNNLLKSTELLTALFGTPGTDRLIRIVYSPRFANAYNRAPLILVSEYYALEQRSQKFGPARDFRLNTHEIAHYWSLADSNTPDEWINEGLAEFSALLISEQIIGKNFSDLLLNEYREIVSNSQTESAIVDTGVVLRDRDVNLYYKPTLLLDEVRQKFGDDKMRCFLKNLYARFSELNTANTSIFLEELEKNFSKETRDSFTEALNRKKWNTSQSLTDNSYITSDTTFKGIWTGPLTQYGSTFKFVLNISFKDRKLIPTLDSPDQNITDIPVNEFKIAGDSLFFKVGVASARYDGCINRDSLTINGEWKQRGVTYPLNLSKVTKVK
jgi:hypothetical protein